MAKARSPKEKLLDTDVAVVEEEKPKRRPSRAKSVERDESDKPARRRTSARREEDTEAPEVTEPPRPVLTPMPSHPLRDEEYQEVRAAAAHEEPAAQPSAPESTETPVVTEVTRDGAPMQVIRLNDLKRMKITDLAKMAHDFGIEGYQGLKKQDLIFSLLSGIADKKFEVHAEA